MTNIYNKKNFNFLIFRVFLKYFILIISFLFLLFFIHNELKNKERIHKFIQIFSDKFNYNFNVYKVNTLKRVDIAIISEIMDQYLDQSIYLIPLNIISENIKNNKWVKNIDLTTNLKNEISVNILEYQPVGIYMFNDKFFYFSNQGKIIDQLSKKNHEKFIIFYGNQSLKKADNFLNLISKIKQNHLFKIKEAYYLNDRRWNVKLDNGLLLYLSEKNIETSLINYIKILNKLKKSEIASIKSIDLRNQKKAIISLKNL
jgi:cell division protein FtsQ